MTNEINHIKRMVSQNGGELEILDREGNGTTLDTCCETESDNLCVYSLKVNEDGKLYGDTSWGEVNLEEVINDKDDWYTLEDIVMDLMSE